MSAASTPPPARREEAAASLASSTRQPPHPHHHHHHDSPVPLDTPRTYPNAGEVIKAYIQHAESRRTSSRFNTRPGTTSNGIGGGGYGGRETGDARLEEDGGGQDDGGELSDVSAVAGLFLGNQKHSSRRLAGPATPSAPPPFVGALPSGAAGARRKLQTDMATLAMAPRPPPVALGGRPRHNLAAKLDTIARTSPWMRRRVVLGDDKGIRSLFRSAVATSPRRAGGTGNNSSAAAIGAAGTSGNGRSTGGGEAGRGHDAATEAEMEKRVMAAFGRIVRRWRERKKQSELAAINIVQGQGAGGSATGAGPAPRFAPKLQRELDAQASNVVSILSRRMIREVPALKFFDDPVEVDANPTVGFPKVKARGPVAGPPEAAKASGMSALAAAIAKTRDRQRVCEPPRGVCYTLDESGCRRIKMQSGAVRGGAGSSSASSGAAASLPADKLDGLSMEAAMTKSLRRKMARRVKSKRLTILRIGDSFERSQRDMALKLRAKLALHQAESDKMFNKKMAVLCSDAADAPPYLAPRELALARARVRKAALIEKCRTLYALGAVLRRIENTGEMTGQDITTGELLFLEAFRCIVEADQVLTPLLTEGVRREFPDARLEMPLVSDLFEILDQHVSGDHPAIEDAWTSPVAVSPTG